MFVISRLISLDDLENSVAPGKLLVSNYMAIKRNFYPHEYTVTFARVKKNYLEIEMRGL
jgi:hypothetical protein